MKQERGDSYQLVALEQCVITQHTDFSMGVMTFAQECMSKSKAGQEKHRSEP